MCEVVVVLYAMTWDGVVMKCHKTYASVLNVLANLEAYIQTRVLRRILECISFEARGGILKEGNGKRPEVAIEEMTNSLTKNKHK